MRDPLGDMGLGIPLEGKEPAYYQRSIGVNVTTPTTGTPRYWVGFIPFGASRLSRMFFCSSIALAADPTGANIVTLQPLVAVPSGTGYAVTTLGKSVSTKSLAIPADAPFRCHVEDDLKSNIQPGSMIGLDFLVTGTITALRGLINGTMVYGG